jgi:hypothetical protein
MATVKLSLACPGVLALIQASTMLTSRYSLTQFSLFMSGSTLAKSNQRPILNPAMDPESSWLLLHVGFILHQTVLLRSLFFWVSLQQVMPKEPGFEQRTELYKLYHYLNHYNLFGSGYRSSCTNIIDSYLAVACWMMGTTATLYHTTVFSIYNISNSTSIWCWRIILYVRSPDENAGWKPGLLSKRVCMNISLECQFEYTSTYWQNSFIEGA